MTSDSPGNHEDLAMSLILYDTLVIIIIIIIITSSDDIQPSTVVSDQ